MDVGRPRRLEMRTSGSWFSLYPIVWGTVMFFKKIGDKNRRQAVFLGGRDAKEELKKQKFFQNFL